MFSLRNIISENNKTFYAYNNNKKVSIRPRIVTTVVISSLIGFFLDRDFKEFLNGVITVQAILIGFSFSVMFFLMSAASTRSTENSDKIAVGKSLEAQLRGEKLETLSREIFHNVAYFNLVAMGCLSVALVILLPNNSDTMWNILKFLKLEKSIIIARTYVAFLAFLGPLVRGLFVFLLLESAFTFARTTGRVNYLFGKSLEARSS